MSKSSSPFFNLALEDWLFKHKTHTEPLLLLYRNSPCVIIGRNQNPWKEVNHIALRRAGVPFIRRRSGGGTVYHDLGNTNFSIHLSRTSFDRNETGKVILSAVQGLGIKDARLNDRNDLCVGPHKVSGSAYKIVNKRAYHHGTMLISTRLDTLGDLLRTSKETMQTKGVASVRSPVNNLQTYLSGLTHSRFVDAVIRAFKAHYDVEVDEEVQYVPEVAETLSIPEIAQGMKELPTWEWAYGQTPEFTYEIMQSFSWGHVHANIRSKHGQILECSFRIAPAAPATIPAPNASEDHTRTYANINQELSVLEERMKGRKYGFLGEGEPLHPDLGPEVGEVVSWLNEEMSS